MESRKRLRSQETDGMQQRKFFINQRIVEKNDKDLMQKVYGKLKIFLAPKNLYQQNNFRKDT
jgi:hypothetical protein